MKWEKAGRVTKKTVPTKIRILSAFSLVPIIAALINLLTTQFAIANVSPEDLLKWSLVPGLLFMMLNYNTLMDLANKD